MWACVAADTVLEEMADDYTPMTQHDANDIFIVCSILFYCLLCSTVQFIEWCTTFFTVQLKTWAHMLIPSPSSS